jgi:hypothetical protein
LSRTLPLSTVEELPKRFFDLVRGEGRSELGLSVRLPMFWRDHTWKTINLII